MSIKTSLEGTIIGKVIQNIAASEPVTTLLGFVLAAVVGSKIDYGKLLNEDPNQIANLISAVVIAVMGYYTNHPKRIAAARIASMAALPDTTNESDKR